MLLASDCTTHVVAKIYILIYDRSYIPPPPSLYQLYLSVTEQDKNAISTNPVFSKLVTCLKPIYCSGKFLAKTYLTEKNTIVFIERADKENSSRSIAGPWSRIRLSRGTSIEQQLVAAKQKQLIIRARRNAGWDVVAEHAKTKTTLLPYLHTHTHIARHSFLSFFGQPPAVAFRYPPM